MLTRHRLKEIGSIVSGLPIPNEKYFSAMGLPFIRATNLKALIAQDNSHQLPRITPEWGEMRALIKVPAKAILFTRNGENALDTPLYQCETEGYIGEDVTAIIPDESVILSDYLLLFLKWYQSSGAGVLHALQQIEIAVPDIEIQTKMIQLFKTSQLLLENKDSIITALDQLKNSTLFEMLGDAQGGEIRPQNRNTEIASIRDRSISHQGVRHFETIVAQIENNKKQLKWGFEQAQCLHNVLLHQTFNLVH